MEWQDGTLYATGMSPDLAKDAWQPHEQRPVELVYTRFPRTRAPQLLADIANACREAKIPFGNPPEVQDISWDKAKTGRLLQQAGIQIPPWVEDVEEMLSALATWGHAFFKPNTGAFGEDIAFLTWDEGRVHIEADDTRLSALTPAQATEWLQRHNEPPRLFQQAVMSPFSGARGLSIRSLVQATPKGNWSSLPRVARVSSKDPVANAARGAEPLPLVDVLTEQWGAEAASALEQELDTLDGQIAETLRQALPVEARPFVVELGLDYVVDSERQVWVLEINGFPQGRLERLLQLDAERFSYAFERGHLRPLRTLLSQRTRNATTT